jgi:hypothetical protein
MGVIDVEKDGKVFVIEAVGHVRRTPVKDWIYRGLGSFVTIRRFRDLSPDAADRIVDDALKFQRQPYNNLFMFGGEGVYCSELAWLAYKDAGIPVGAVQTLGSLHLDNIFVRNLIEQRWRKHPLCQDDKSWESCAPKIMDQKLITPASIEADPHFVTVFSNYL